MLVMTATPIPRTVAMTVYGDLEVSALRELPAGRSPIATTVVPLAERPSWFESRVAAGARGGRGGAPGLRRVPAGRRSEAGRGRRGRAADDEESEARRPPLAVLDVLPKLAEGELAGLRLGLLHGKLPADEKDTVMRAFERGELDVLVATTVIEVGVDVPNATAMVILDADRFGLSSCTSCAAGWAAARRPGCACWSPTCPPPPPPAPGSTRSPTPPTASRWPSWIWSCGGRATCSAPLQSGRRSGLRLLSLLKHEEIIAKARVYAMDIVEHDPTLAAHGGLAALVGQTVGDEERAAWLDRV